MVQFLSSVWVGINLQLVFVILFFGTLLPKMNNVMGAVTCLIIGLLSLVNGICSIKSKQNSILSIVVILVAVLILAFTIFAYFLGEAGYPPLITQ